MAIDMIAANRKVVYEQQCPSRNTTRTGTRPLDNSSSHDICNNSRLAIHELCKITTSPTSVLFSKDEVSDDEGDDESQETDAAEELDQIFDACELEERTKIYEVTQFMIDVSHSAQAAFSWDNGNKIDENINDDFGSLEERQGSERSESRDHGISHNANEGDNDENEYRNDQLEDNEDSRQHVGDSDSSTTHESILSCVDSMGKTPLHILCENSCDSTMMRVIFGSTREATGNPIAPTALSLILAKDSRGSTPLHYLAYSRQCPFSSLKLMMDYCKPYTSVNEKRHDPTLCTDDDGETPLHWALAGYVSSRRIKELTRHSTDAIVVKNQKGETPFDQFTTNFANSDWTDNDICGQEIWENIQEYLRVIYDNQMNDEYKRITIIPDSKCNNSINGDSIRCNNQEWLPLHFLAGSNYDFPPIFIDLALKYCHEDLQKVDVNGMIPLHLACGRKKSNVLNCVHGKDKKESKDSEKVVNHDTDTVAIKILKNFHGASLIKVRSTKRLALHMAVESRKSFPLIAALVRTYPRSLNIPDPITKLWPFVLSGIGEDGNDNRSNESLSVSYTLLRGDPSVLHLAQKTVHINNLTAREQVTMGDRKESQRRRRIDSNKRII